MQSELDRFFDAPINGLVETESEVAAALAAELVKGTLLPKQVDAIVLPFADRLRTLDVVDVFGSGFAAAPAIMADATAHLAWWQGDPARRLVRAAQEVNKDTIDFTTLEWFRIPRDAGQPHIAGPFVDYLCNDSYTVTFAAPVRVNGEFVGVLALDLLVDSIERVLMPLLRRSDRELAVLARTGRVLATTRDDLGPGDSVRGLAIREAGETVAPHGFRLIELLTE